MTLAARDEDACAARQGEVVGGVYRLLERIGAGGMGEVYAAEHIRVGRHFAVKLLRAGEGATGRQRFRREIGAIARIENEHVVRVIDCGEASDGTPYLVMDLLRGEDLRCLLRRAAPLPARRAVNLALDVCRGLEAVHREGLVHRDLKPENLFLTRRSTGADCCVILDFGVAKMDSSLSTVTGALIGTARYMAPEQLRDGSSVSHSTDIYAVGAILYECLCGVPPYSGLSLPEVMFKIMNDEPRRLEHLCTNVPKQVANAVHRALAKSPDDRFESVQLLAQAIAPYAEVNAPTQSTAEITLQESRAMHRAPRAKVPAWLFLASGLVVGAGGATLARNKAVAPSAAPAITTAKEAINRMPARASDSVVLPPIVLTSKAPEVTTEQARPASINRVPTKAKLVPITHTANTARANFSIPTAAFDADNPYAH